MTDEPPPAQGAERFVVRATAESNFAWLRTRLSVERTFMSWVRTATALIGFGFAIVQFFDRLADMQGVAAARRPQLSRDLGLALIGAGVAALLVSCWQYLWVLKYMWSPSFRPIAGVREGGMLTPALAIGIVLILIGIVAFVAVLLRVP